MSLMATLMQKPDVAECCDEGGRVCARCGRTVCLEHSDPAPVDCEVNGTTCGDCHAECTSVACARVHADPDI